MIAPSMAVIVGGTVAALTVRPEEHTRTIPGIRVRAVQLGPVTLGGGFATAHVELSGARSNRVYASWEVQAAALVVVAGVVTTIYCAPQPMDIALLDDDRVPDAAFTQVQNAPGTQGNEGLRVRVTGGTVDRVTVLWGVPDDNVPWHGTEQGCDV